MAKHIDLIEHKQDDVWEKEETRRNKYALGNLVKYFKKECHCKQY